MNVVGAAGKGGVCWKETRDGLRSGLRGGVGSIAGDWELCLWLAHPLEGRSGGFDYG